MLHTEAWKDGILTRVGIWEPFIGFCFAGVQVAIMASQRFRLRYGSGLARNAGLTAWLLLLSVGSVAAETFATNLRASCNFETTTHLGLDVQGTHSLTMSGNAVASTNRVIGSCSVSLDGARDYLSATTPTTALQPAGISFAAWVPYDGSELRQYSDGIFRAQTVATGPLNDGSSGSGFQSFTIGAEVADDGVFPEPSMVALLATAAGHTPRRRLAFQKQTVSP